MTALSSIAIYTTLFLYAFFHRISSSEFWPITVSKSWFGVGGSLEASMLQKPLLSFILSSLHVFQIRDSTHIYMVKVIFSLIGVASVYFFSRFLSQLIEKTTDKKISHLVLAPGLCLLSPVFLNNFFNIRTDQIAFLFLTLFFCSYENKKIKSAIFCLFLLLMSGIKEVALALPALFLLYSQLEIKFPKKTLYYSLALLIGALIWVLGLNISVLDYIRESYRNNPFPNDQLSRFLLSEGLLLLLTGVLLIYNLVKRQFLFWTAQSIFFIVLLFINPQSYEFYIASLVPIIYIPLFLRLASIWQPHRLKIILSTGIFFSAQLALTYQNKATLYESNLAQLEFIDKASEIVRKRRLLYLDGMGILPKQRFSRCFVSPDDLAANANCIDQIVTAKADVVILTRRLAFLNDPALNLFESIEKRYTQVYPNLWVRNDQLDERILEKRDLSGKLPLPIIIF